MKALVAAPKAAGGIELRETAEPKPTDNQAIVAVRSISLNRGECTALRAAEDGWRPGWDLAGVVATPADDGSGPTEGTRVVGWVERGSLGCARNGSDRPPRRDPGRPVIRDGLDAAGGRAHGGRGARRDGFAPRPARRDHGSGGRGRAVRDPARAHGRRARDGDRRQARAGRGARRARGGRDRRGSRAGGPTLRPRRRVGGRFVAGGRGFAAFSRGRDRLVRELLERAGDVRSREPSTARARRGSSATSSRGSCCTGGSGRRGSPRSRAWWPRGGCARTSTSTFPGPRPRVRSRPSWNAASTARPS